jgi:uncharacterized protein (TIGR02145 family)
MKRLFTILALVLLTATMWAQSPQQMSYQAVIRDDNSVLVKSHAVGVRISILQGVNPVYVETHATSTNANGLVTIEIGGGTFVSGVAFSAIDWLAGTYSIKTETDPTGGTNYTAIVGTSLLLSVPYALHAKTVASYPEADPIFVAWNKSTGINISASQVSDFQTSVTTNSAVVANTAKNSYPTADAAKLAAITGTNTGDETAATIKTKLGITTLSGSNTGDQTLAGLGGVASNTAITGETKTKITYDTKGLVTAGENATTADIAASTDKNYVTDTQLTVIGNTSGTNTGDQDITAMVHTNRTALDAVSGTNTGDQDLSGKVDKVTGKDLAPNGTIAGQMQYWNGSAWVTVTPGSTGQVLTFVSGVPTWGAPGMGMGANDVYNPKTGKIWMDRNLGATQVATSSTDANSYGYLYQWGRNTDGHQSRTSLTTPTLSSTDTPGHGSFILAPNNPYDWRSPQNDNLWQGVSGTNNPCPSGYRLPTEAEWNAERLSWSSNNAAGAFASPLKLPVAGYRDNSNGSLLLVGAFGLYWSSTVSSTNSCNLNFYSSNGRMDNLYRAYGLSVRCLKE